MDSILQQRASRLQQRNISVEATFRNRGYHVGKEVDFPLMFYKPDNDRAKMEQNRVNCTIKLRNDQIEHIEKTARNEEEVLMLTKQIQEHGDFTDPIQERLESIAAGKNVEMQAELTEVRKQMDELTKQNAELLAALRREREGAAKTTKAAAKK